VFRVVALPAPTERQKSQMYMQRYIEHFPASGEIVIFDRSWYNRAGVEYVMGFCTAKQHRRFLENCTPVENYIKEARIHLIKIWLEVGQKEQERRFRARVEDPLRQWKLSPMDVESYDRWYDYSKARDLMFKYTDTADSPWYLVDSNDKKRARLNIISHILAQLPYERVKHDKIRLPERSDRGKYDDAASLKGRRFVEQKF
jgi:polyphosphate kinase 2